MQSPPPLLGQGFHLRHVSIKEQIIDNSFSQTLELLYNNSIVQNVMKLSAFRTIFPNFAMFFINIDRLQLYIYHNRKYSTNSELFLMMINRFQTLEFVVIKDLYQILGIDYNEKAQEIMKKLEFKNNYTKMDVHDWQNVPRISQLQENGYKDSFVDNESQFFTIFLPFVFFIFILLALLFHLTKGFPFSAAYRRYEFYGLLFLIMIEGNVEELTFYIVKEVKFIISLSFQNKIYNSIMHLMFFLLIFTSTCLFVMYKFQYKKKIKYFVETKRKDLVGLFSSTIDRTLVCIAFGFIHRLFLNDPNLQLLILALLQTLWICQKLWALRKNVYQSKTVAILWIFQGFLRIILQLSFLIYENYTILRQFINGLHQFLIITYIGIMFTQFLINFLQLLKQIYKIIKKTFEFYQTKQIIQEKDQQIKDYRKIRLQRSAAKKLLRKPLTFHRKILKKDEPIKEENLQTNRRKDKSQRKKRGNTQQKRKRDNIQQNNKGQRKQQIDKRQKQLQINKLENISINKIKSLKFKKAHELFNKDNLNVIYQKK